MWRMPLNDQFRRYMTDTPFADIRNGSSGGRAGPQMEQLHSSSSSFQRETTKKVPRNYPGFTWTSLGLHGAQAPRLGQNVRTHSSNTEPRESMSGPCTTLSLKTTSDLMNICGQCDLVYF